MRFYLGMQNALRLAEPPEDEIKTRPIYNCDTYKYSESMKKECAEVIKSVTQKDS